uniref:Uncharacterized protein n=1 Tax=Caenorhabditis japonica TaxID=281687 RepID=A0A8R1HZZ3_CAEJA
MESLIKSFLVYVRPILEYGSVIFSPIGTVLIRRIESVQKSFVYRCCTKFGVHYASYFSTLETLVLESLEYRRLITDMMFLYKCIVAKDIACPSNLYLSFANCSSLRRHSYYLRSNISNFTKYT